MRFAGSLAIRRAASWLAYGGAELDRASAAFAVTRIT